ncbi:MAG: hypothetical protein J5490_00310 [Bacteroidales bacterium]|nr:hypothetical protein [Bacteroidales bacterium]
MALGAIAAFTCPDKQAHKDALLSVVNESINNRLQQENLEGLGSIVGSIGSGVAGAYLDNRLVVKDHFLCSTGEIQNLSGDVKQVSFGIFGHVYPLNKDDLREAMGVSKSK